MRRLLILPYYFLPRNHVACYRAGCFAKFLPENGWKPTVVCEDVPAVGPDSDPDFIGILPESVEIHRVAAPRPRGSLERFLHRTWGQYLQTHRLPLHWSEHVGRRVRELIQTTRFDAVWATSDPLGPLALADETARSLGVPWVADLRDSFSVLPFGKWYKRPLFASRERSLCRRADRVTTVSEGLARGLAPLIGKEPVVIHNGFDPTLFPQAPMPQRPKFTLLYAGNLVRSPGLVFSAVELCIHRGWIPRDQIELLFHGVDVARIERYCPGAAGRVPIQAFPRLPHREILRVMGSSAVLLLMAHADTPGVLPAKGFDYLASGRPILAVPDDHGEVSRFLGRTGAGVSLSDPEAIARQLAEWFEGWKTGRGPAMPRDDREIARYSRREQTRQLAGVLDDLMRR